MVSFYGSRHLGGNDSLILSKLESIEEAVSTKKSPKRGSDVPGNVSHPMYFIVLFPSHVFVYLYFILLLMNFISWSHFMDVI